jgi:hypothetical protein
MAECIGRFLIINPDGFYNNQGFLAKKPSINEQNTQEKWRNIC